MAIPELLQASAQVYGDVVKALLSDLHGATSDVGSLAWLAGTRHVLEGEVSYQMAVAQLRWWDALLDTLPCPRPQSDLRRVEVDRYRAARARARLLARDRALAAHRARVDEEQADPRLSDERRAQLRAERDDPAGAAWRVDPSVHEAAAIAALGPEPAVVPVVAADFDPTQPYSCFVAVDAMRAHGELGPRARHMDGMLVEVLHRRFGLSRKAAEPHARLLTDIFWVALRRTLQAGSHQLAATVQLLASADEAPLQAGFAREVLESWQHHLAQLPPKPPSIGQRIGRLLGRAPTAALPADRAHRLLGTED